MKELLKGKSTDHNKAVRFPHASPGYRTAIGGPAVPTSPRSTPAKDAAVGFYFVTMFGFFGSLSRTQILLG